jgi:hypothetical protein
MEKKAMEGGLRREYEGDKKKNKNTETASRL